MTLVVRKQKQYALNLALLTQAGIINRDWDPRRRALSLLQRQFKKQWSFSCNGARAYQTRVRIDA